MVMKRAALTTALVAVALSAALGVYALVGGGFGDTEGKVLGTSLLVTAAAVIALAAAVALEGGRLGRLPYLGVAAAIAGFGMLVVGVWAELDVDAYLRTAFTLVVVSLAVGYMGLIGLARLPGRQQWTVTAAYVLAGVAAGMIAAAIWFEPPAEAYWRGGGVVFILLAAATVTVPILHRMADIPGPVSRGESAPITHCPFCGASATGIAGSPVHCPACGRDWSVEVR
jgi:hypothetical protein